MSSVPSEWEANLNGSDVQARPKRGLVSRVLEPALRLWLRSQTEALDRLEVYLDSGDRQILAGHIPQVRLLAQKAVYQGLHLSRVQLCGQNLRINIGQVLKGKPLQLLEPIPVAIEVQLQAADVQASLGSELLEGAILETLQRLVGEQIAVALDADTLPQALTLSNSQIVLGDGCLRLSTQVIAKERSIPVALQTGLGLSNPNTLVLTNPEWLPTPQAKKGLRLRELDGYTLDLGPQVQFESFLITPDGIYGQGKLTIFPGE